MRRPIAQHTDQVVFDLVITDLGLRDRNRGVARFEGDWVGLREDAAACDAARVQPSTQ